VPRCEIDRVVARSFGERYAERPYDNLATLAVADPQPHPGRRVTHLSMFDPWAREDRPVDLWVDGRAGSASTR
jgi:hypothetical protein